MRNLRVCIYGGTELEGPPAEFIPELAYTILKSMPATIVTGGFIHSKEKPAKPNVVSTDKAALDGARRFVADYEDSRLEDCFEACIPEPSLDERANVRVVRMTEQDGITIQRMPGRTPLGRRLAMVAGVDVVVTIAGHVHTEVVIEQALELGLPVLPIPYAGGDSEAMMQKHKQRIAASFGPGALDQCLGTLSSAIANDRRKAAAAVVELLATAKFGKCLVLLPYDRRHDALYETDIKTAVSRHMIPVRLDRLPTSEAIYTSFADSIRSSTAVIADITALNKNVMYEIGYAHGLGLKPLIYTRQSARLDRLPVYFRTLNVRVAGPGSPLAKLIDEYLGSFKAQRKGRDFAG